MTTPVATRAAGGLAMVAGAGVVVLAVSARDHTGPARLDPDTAADVLGLRTNVATVIAHVLTFVGSEVVVGAIALVILGWLFWRRDLEHAIPFGAAMAGSAVLTVVVKALVARSRPGRVDVLGAIDHSHSFPSGHTLNSAVLIGLVIWLAWPSATSLTRMLMLESGTLLVLGIAASRVYLGYHWLTDVLASLLLALAWLSTVWLVREPLVSVWRRVVHV